MKLLSLHINNYGKLSNYDYNFSDISSLCEDNGYGKSTIVSFIKAMFYGLETTKTGSPSFFDRKHFYPFKGGKFGGNIEFIYRNKKYRIEREFDEKSETKDKLKVYCNNNLTNELGDVPGVTIFGINKGSFERLITIDANKISIQTNDDINKKLNNYVENVREDFDIASVIKKLNDKKKTKKDILSKSKGSIKSLEEDIRYLESRKNILDSKYQKLNEAELEKKQATGDFTKKAGIGTIISNWKTYDGFISDIDIEKNKLNEIKNKYHKGFPNEKDLEDLKNNNDKIIRIDGSINSLNNSSDNKEKFDTLNKKYSKHLPKESELEEIENNIKEYEKIQETINDIINEEKSEKEIELEKHFFGEIIEDEKINELEKEINDLNSKEKELSEINPFINQKEAKDGVIEKNNKVLSIILLILSILLFGAGVGFLFINNIIGIVLIILGVVVIIFDMFIYFKQYINNNNQNDIIVQKDNPIYISKKKEINDLENRLLKKFASFRYDGDKLEVLLYQLKKDLEDYKTILQNKENKDIELTKYKEKLSELTESLNKFFNEVNMSGISYKKALDIVKDDLSKLDTLKGIIDTNINEKEKFEKEKEEILSSIKDFYLKYNMSNNYSIENINNDISEYKRISLDIIDKEKKALEYKENNNLVDRPTEEVIDLELLKKEIEVKNNNYSNLFQEIRELEDETSNIEDKNNKLQNEKELREETEEKIKLYESLIEELKKADQVLKDKYISPIKERFIYYANLIEATIGEKITMDKDYKISFDREGALRSVEHLSSGNMAICSLCFRLALIDNMFEGELPFVIMDDPFVNLDSNHLLKTFDLIKELANNKQIIYFTCHESRNLQ